MYWETPSWLFLLWLLPLVMLLLFRARKRNLAAADVFAEPESHERLFPFATSARGWCKGTFLVLGLALLITGLARPRWGVFYETVESRGVDLFVLLDVSRSMLASDIAPNRLERAKSDIRDLLPHLVGDRVGLIVFAGAAVVQVPLTTDHGFFLTALEAVDPTSAPRGGSLIGDAIRKSLEAFQTRADRDQVLILMTDGEDHDSFPAEAARQAAERGVKIFTIGLGDTAEGQRIPIRDEQGNVTFLKQDGKEVLSKMDEKLLKEIALTTGGAYVPAQTRAYDLGAIYRDHLSQLTQGETSSEKRKRYRERFQIFVVAGFVLLLGESMISRFHSTARTARLPKSISATFVMTLLFGFTLVANPTFAAPREAARQVTRGIEKHLAGDFKGAEQEFASAAATAPDDLRIVFDQACAAAAQGKHDEAEQLFAKSKLARDPHLAASSWYNLGHIAAQQAKTTFGNQPENADAKAREEGLKQIEQAVAHYRSCLALNPQHENARHNLELLRLWVKHMRELWKQRDREKRRNETDVLAFLEQIQAEQKTLREGSRQLAGENDSPRRRQAAVLLGHQQRELSEEIKPLQDKLREAVTAPPGGTPAQSSPPQLTEQQEEALGALNQLALQSKNAMARAAGDLASNALPAAEESQSRALEPLNEIYRTIAPFDRLLRKAIQVQEMLIEQTPVQEDTAAQGPPTWVEQDLTDQERNVAGWAEILKPKAQQLLESLKSQPAVAGPAPPPGSSGDQKPDPAATRQSLIETYEKAIELDPEAQAAASEAASLLEKRSWQAATAKEQEALEKLKEIEKQLPQQSQDNQQDSSQQQQQQQKQQDESQQEKSSDQDKSSEKKQEQKTPKPAEKKDLAKEQAEKLLRQVRERERDYREKQKAQAVIGGVIVEKDW